LRRLLFGLPSMPSDLSTEAVTLLLLLLYDTNCKYTAGEGGCVAGALPWVGWEQRGAARRAAPLPSAQDTSPDDLAMVSRHRPRVPGLETPAHQRCAGHEWLCCGCHPHPSRGPALTPIIAIPAPMPMPPPPPPPKPTSTPMPTP
jgi:hypothetical protein